MRKEGWLGVVAILALGLAGFTGCDGEKSAAPVSEAWCKTKYADEASCVADSACQWKVNPDKGIAKCDEKSKK